MARIVIDPVTRVGGQLRVEADLDGGRVAAAWASATMFRGMEHVLRGRDPRDAWLLAQRICGTCTGVHAAASVRAVERALGIEIPPNAALLRNLLAGAGLVRDHVVTLYQRSLPDWVDVASAITADPVATSRLATTRSAWHTSTPDQFRAVRDRIAGTIAAGQPGPFAPAWPGHPAYRLTPEQGLLLLAHLLDALDWQRQFTRLHALLSGKEAHPQTYLVGGMALAPPWGGPSVTSNRQHPPVPDRDSPLALSDEGIALMRGLVRDARTFIDQVVVPDTHLLIEAYPEWVTMGRAPGGYLCNGEFPDAGGRDAGRLFPNGRLAGGNLQRSEPVIEAGVGESIAHAWYTDGADGQALHRPSEAAPSPAYTAQVPLAQLSVGARYSWVKAPRLDGRVMETGPLARVLVGLANGRPEVRNALGRRLTDAGLTADAIGGALGRTLARGVELEVVGAALDTWLTGLEAGLASGDLAIANIERWDPSSWPSEAEGWSLGEGPRGSVAHWLRIKDGVIDHYQVVDGSTWNASPRDGDGHPGPLEAALEGIEVADPAQPVELLRVIHSFAPCGACAAHALGAVPGHRSSVLLPVPERTR